MGEYVENYDNHLYRAGRRILLFYPADDVALTKIKRFIKDHNLDKEKVRIIKNSDGMSLVAKIDVTLFI